MRNNFLIAVLIFCGALPNAARAAEPPCSIEQPCTISGENGGRYYLGIPDGWTGEKALSPFVYFHGHNGSGMGVVKNRSLLRKLAGKGFLLIAPDGPEFTFRGRTTKGWAARPEGDKPRGGRDDIAFVERVLTDAAQRVKINLDRTVVTGFSSGGSMAWYYACYSKNAVASVVAVAGGLRRPLPLSGPKREDGSLFTKCPSQPRRLLHIHGFSDRQVPLEGRGIRSWHQGDVFEGLAIQRNTNGCGSRPDSTEVKGAFWCRTWSNCASKTPVRMCLHSGGHGMPKGWLEEALRWSTPNG